MIAFGTGVCYSCEYAWLCKPFLRPPSGPLPSVLRASLRALLEPNPRSAQSPPPHARSQPGKGGGIRWRCGERALPQHCMDSARMLTMPWPLPHSGVAFATELRSIVLNRCDRRCVSGERVCARRAVGTRVGGGAGAWRACASTGSCAIASRDLPTLLWDGSQKRINALRGESEFTNSLYL